MSLFFFETKGKIKMLVFACIGYETRVLIPLEELKNGKHKSYEGYVFYEISEESIAYSRRDKKWCFGYPLYSSKSNIPERLKTCCKIKAFRCQNKELYEAIKQREDTNKKIKATLGVDLDDPYSNDVFESACFENYLRRTK